MCPMLQLSPNMSSLAFSPTLVADILFTSKYVEFAQRDPSLIPTPSEYSPPLEKVECDGTAKTRSLSRAVAPELDMSGPTKQAAGSAWAPPRLTRPDRAQC